MATCWRTTTGDKSVNMNLVMFSMGQGNVFTCAQNKETYSVSNYDKIIHQRECFSGFEVQIRTPRACSVFILLGGL